MTTYYVSSASGSDNNAGTAAGSPLATLQAAADLVRPGDTVEVMNGTYSNASGDGGVLQITTSGTAAAPIRFQAMPGQTPVIDSAGNWSGIVDNGASYVTISGFTIQGDAPSVTLAEAQSQDNNTNNPVTAGDGIDIQAGSGGSNPHNVIVEDNTVRNQPGGGIVSMDADYVQILNNVTYDNAKYSPYAASGISLGFSKNYNTAPGVHDTISGNISYDNTELVPFHVTGTITDGEGIIVDSNNLNGYTGKIIVENNTAYGNSGPGIEDFDSNNVTITGNTAYQDTTNARLASEGQISISESSGSTSTSNKTTAPTSSTSSGSDPSSSAAPSTSSSGDPPGTIVSPSTLTLQLSENAYQGNAEFIVKMDGKQIGGPTAVTANESSGASDTFAYSGDWAAGPHKVEVDFINDRYGGTPATDRNLYIDQITYDKSPGLSHPVELASNGGFVLAVGATS
jgi:parallel beta-helix repeat protein